MKFAEAIENLIQGKIISRVSGDSRYLWKLESLDPSLGSPAILLACNDGYDDDDDDYVKSEDLFLLEDLTADDWEIYTPQGD